ncbi:MAG: glycerate kinase [Proteobacteria bacterium]|nr:glycerate kinase [Pseudomonadota bacterium]
MTAEQDRPLRTLFEAALEAVSAESRIVSHLPPPVPGRTLVVGAGKAAAAMARAVEQQWRGDIAGLVGVPYGHGVACDSITVIEAAHPVPDDAGQAAAARIMAMAATLSEGDQLLALMSGGGSALLALPAPAVTLAHKQALSRALLRSGATISEINTVRKHLSAIKGGRLARAAHPARIVTLAISDIPGDDPALIASGPTLPDRTTVTDALETLSRYNLTLPPEIAAWLADPAAESPKPGDPGFEGDRVTIIARAREALDGAAAAARLAGYHVDCLGDAIEGEASTVGAAHAALALIPASDPGRLPLVLLSGGETTVTVTGNSGSGGRNTEYLLALGLALDGHPGISAIACDTDGIDGNSEAAGAILRPDSLARARALGLDPARMLRDHDSASLFGALGDLVKTGPTLTNVNDFRAILIGAGSKSAVNL